MSIKINTGDAKRGHDTDYEVNKTQIFIGKFKENKIKELEYEIRQLKLQLTNQSKSKCISCQKMFYEITKMENTQSEINPIKTGKIPGTTYCLGCKNYTHNFKSQEIKMTNKVLREKCNCVVCRSNKSRFLKQKRNNKK